MYKLNESLLIPIEFKNLCFKFHMLKDLAGICSIFREIDYLRSQLKIFNMLFTKTKMTENLILLFLIIIRAVLDVVF